MIFHSVVHELKYKIVYELQVFDQNVAVIGIYISMFEEYNEVLNKEKLQSQFVKTFQYHDFM